MQRLIREIKKKKELEELSDKYVKKQINNFLKKNYKAKKFLAEEYSPRSSFYKKIVKEIRAELRRSFGLFRNDSGNSGKDIHRILREFKNSTNKKDIIKEILKIHSSTRERLPYYAEIYQEIFKITGKPKRILDLGCGVNPFSQYYMKLDDLVYDAYDLGKEEIKAINKYFEFSRVHGKAFILDITQTNNLRKLPPANIAFLFKMTDVLDKRKGHKKSEEVLQAIPAEFVVISFPTLTMSGKKMNFPRRKWIEYLCTRLNYPFKYFSVMNEIFYVIEKSNN
jgi:hypothetical protein